MSIKKELDELVDAQVISTTVADDIAAYYATKKEAQPNRVLLVFGVIGALLVGLGIILILAHNWDNFPRGVQSFFALLPMLIGQGACAYAFFKKYDSATWREASSVFLVFAVGGGIAMLGQIYNLPGDEATFLLTWLLLCLPLVYVMESSVVALLYLAGITRYAIMEGFWDFNWTDTLTYIALLGLVLPYYVLLCKNKPQSNGLSFLHWGIVISAAIALGLLADDQKRSMFLAYMCLFGLFYVIGNTSFFKNQRLRSNAFRVVGIVGNIVLLFVLSFFDLGNEIFRKVKMVFGTELLASVLLTITAAALLLQQGKEGLKNPFQYLVLLAIPLFFLGLWSPFSVSILVNILLLALGIWIIYRGAHSYRLGTLNFGLVIIAILIICRFFDLDIPFIVRGLLFVGIGIGFFYANYQIVQSKKSQHHVQ